MTHVHVKDMASLHQMGFSHSLVITEQPLMKWTKGKLMKAGFQLSCRISLTNIESSLAVKQK